MNSSFRHPLGDVPTQTGTLPEGFFTPLRPGGHQPPQREPARSFPTATMPTWHDIEDVMAYWFREGDRGAWADWPQLDVDIEALASRRVGTSSPHRRSG